MATMQPASRSSWDIVSLAVVALAVFSHLYFLAHDSRVLRDLNLSYFDLPSYYQGLGEPGRWPALLQHALRNPGGLPSLALAAIMQLTGARSAVLHFMNLGAVVGSVLGAGLLARRLAGPAAGAAAAAFVAGAPGFFALGREPWLHVPEAALVLFAATALVADPGLTRRRTVAMGGLLGFVALSWRASAIPWVATLAMFVVLSGRASPGGPRVPRRWLWLAGIWSLGLIPNLASLHEYMSRKVDMRESYSYLAGIEVLIGHTMYLLGELSWVLALGGALIFLFPPWPRGERGRLVLLLISWVLAGLALHLLFRAGLGDFPLALAGAAILGAAGLLRLSRWAGLLPILTLLMVHSLQILPDSLRHNPLYRLVYGQMLEPCPMSHLIPWHGIAPQTVLTLLDATCPDDRRCVIYTDHSLFHPMAEEPGNLELFLLGRQRVTIVPLYAGPMGHLEPPDALASYSCHKMESHWVERHPFLPSHVASTVERHRLRQVWYEDLQGGCRYRWLAPGGAVRRPDLLPGVGETDRQR